MTVYLVGAGPGDPGLLTRRGAELLARADVVLYDRLVSPALLDLAPAGAQLIDVGKRPDAAGSGEGGRADGEVAGQDERQEEIARLLVEHGRSGGVVVRLKGGDPFLFGRGGEEVEALAAAGIPFEVVPGVTSAFAAPAVAGIPVTHRGVASSVTVVTGRVGGAEGGEATGAPDWEALATRRRDAGDPHGHVDARRHRRGAHRGRAVAGHAGCGHRPRHHRGPADRAYDAGGPGRGRPGLAGGDRGRARWWRWPDDSPSGRGAAPCPGRTVVVTRSAARGRGGLVDALERAGAPRCELRA